MLFLAYLWHLVILVGNLVAANEKRCLPNPALAYGVIN